MQIDDQEEGGAAVGKKTIETLKAGEKIMEAIEIAQAEEAQYKEYEEV